MAPEAWDGQRSEQTDLWSVGVMLYEMVSGRLPFPQAELMPLFLAIANSEPAPLPSTLSPSLTRVIQVSLKKDPSQRYRSATEMLSHLPHHSSLPSALAPPLTGLAPDTLGGVQKPPENVGAAVSEPAVGLRYDGLYLAGIDQWRCYLRFFEDGCVLSAVSSAVISLEYVTNLLNKSAVPTTTGAGLNLVNVSRGTFKMTGTRLQFTTECSGGKVDFEGELKDAVLDLRIYSHINRHRSRIQFSFKATSLLLIENQSKSEGDALEDMGKESEGHARSPHDLGMKESEPRFSTLIPFSPPQGQREPELRAVNQPPQPMSKPQILQGREILTLRGHSEPVYCLAFSPDGSRLASGNGPDGKKWRTVGEIKVWELETGSEILSLKGHQAEILSLAFSPDGRRLVSASQDTTVKVWDARTGEEERTLHGHCNWASGVAFSPDGRFLATAGGTGTGATFICGLKVWEVETGRLDVSLKGGHRLAFSPDGKYLAGRGQGYETDLKIWEWQTEQEVLCVKGLKGSLNSLAFSPDGRCLAVATGEANKYGDLKVWDVATGQVIRSLEEHPDDVNCVDYSPDGQYLVSACFDQKVRVWNAEAGEKVLTLKGHTAWVRSVAFSPEGQRIASASDDQTVRIWRFVE